MCVREIVWEEGRRSGGRWGHSQEGKQERGKEKMRVERKGARRRERKGLLGTVRIPLGLNVLGQPREASDCLETRETDAFTWQRGTFCLKPGGRA